MFSWLASQQCLLLHPIDVVERVEKALFLWKNPNTILEKAEAILQP
jgi:hypothetical protein